jgi:hypothetical protein
MQFGWHSGSGTTVRAGCISCCGHGIDKVLTIFSQSDCRCTISTRFNHCIVSCHSASTNDDGNGDGLNPNWQHWKLVTTQTLLSLETSAVSAERYHLPCDRRWRSSLLTHSLAVLYVNRQKRWLAYQVAPSKIPSRSMRWLVQAAMESDVNSSVSAARFRTKRDSLSQLNSCSCLNRIDPWQELERIVNWYSRNLFE